MEEGVAEDPSRFPPLDLFLPFADNFEVEVESIGSLSALVLELKPAIGVKGEEGAED